MLVRSFRRACAPRNLAATCILTIATAGIAFAAVNSRDIVNNSVSGVDIKNNSIGTLDLQNNSITEADVKNGSLRGRDFKANSITGNQIDESTLGKVPSAAAADTATSATNATTSTNATLADKAKGVTRIAPSFVAATDAADFATGQANAPFTTLAEAGSLKLQAKCFRNTTTDTVHGEVYATTTVDAAVMTSDVDSLSGGATVNNTNYLFTDTILDDRQVLTTSVGNNSLANRGAIDHDFTMLGTDGSWIVGEVTIVARNGAPSGAPTTFYGSEHSCAFFGIAEHSGNA